MLGTLVVNAVSGEIRYYWVEDSRKVDGFLNGFVILRMGFAYLNYKCHACREQFNNFLLLLPFLWEVLKQKIRVCGDWCFFCFPRSFFYLWQNVPLVSLLQPLPFSFSHRLDFKEHFKPPGMATARGNFTFLLAPSSLCHLLMTVSPGHTSARARAREGGQSWGKNEELVWENLIPVEMLLCMASSTSGIPASLSYLRLLISSLLYVSEKDV